ncbi:MAG: hypothetical protein V1725_00610 [archaeon]
MNWKGADRQLQAMLHASVAKRQALNTLLGQWSTLRERQLKVLLATCAEQSRLLLKSIRKLPADGLATYQPTIQEDMQQLTSVLQEQQIYFLEKNLQLFSEWRGKGQFWTLVQEEEKILQQLQTTAQHVHAFVEENTKSYRSFLTTVMTRIRTKYGEPSLLAETERGRVLLRIANHPVVWKFTLEKEQRVVTSIQGYPRKKGTFYLQFINAEESKGLDTVTNMGLLYTTVEQYLKSKQFTHMTVLCVPGITEIALKRYGFSKRAWRDTALGTKLTRLYKCLV